MRVKCVANDVHKLRSRELQERLGRSIRLDGADDDLHIGESYDVFVLRESDGGLWVLLDTVPQSDHPYPYPLEMFDVVDASIPEDWSIGFERRAHGTTMTSVGFSEWVKDATFYERLLDREPDALAIWERQRLKRSIK